MYPSASPARTTPISDPQTNREFPKNGESTRLAAISTPRSTAPEMKTATPTASVETVRWVRSDFRRRCTDERCDASRGHDHCIHAGPLELADLLAVVHLDVGDRKLAGGNVPQQP